MKLWKIAKALRHYGIVGMNRRNAEFILPHNRRKFYPLVDDKEKTKLLAIEHNIPVPELYGKIVTEHDIRNLSEILQDKQDFVIKPAQGSGGDGIIVVVGRHKHLYRMTNGLFMKEGDLNHHISSILSGVYSLGGHADKALIEYRVIFDPVFDAVSHQGVPDIRVIVFNGYPAMAMLRLPTRTSQGKANLHQGAIGVGIRIASGETTSGVWLNEIIDEHPDTINPIKGLQVPSWEEILDLSARCYELAGLGYLGVDIVLDKNLGPLMLELNARPGLNIQIANQAGLEPRLRTIQQHIAQHSGQSVADRVAFSKSVFQ